MSDQQARRVVADAIRRFWNGDIEDDRMVDDEAAAIVHALEKEGLL